MAKLRQDRAVRTREAILEAAAEVFDACGYSGTSIRLIMERAQVTQGGMYFHFKSKQAIAEAVIASQQEFVRFPDGEDGLQRLIDITFHLARELQTNTRFRASVRLAVDQEEFGKRDATPYFEWAEQFRRQLVVARQRGELRDDVDEREFAAVLMASYSGTQIFSNMSTGRQDLPQRVTALWRYLLPGVADESVIGRLRITPAEAGPHAA
ncbi:ScbR family autoregulator-binding transcription factor [Streptomyces caeni]|uniref:ScbR family autoregulator-binding transcription factor n=1 Tax=Streptomyces caeni TaxID=2307231 RepID=A0ABW4ILG1_9ACTN